MALQDMLQNLGGFQSLAANAQRMQQAEQQQMQTKEASDLLRTFYKSQQDGKPDYNSLNEAILRSPELAQNVLSGIGIQDKQKQQQNTMQQQQVASDVVTLYQSLGNKDMFNSAAAKRVNEIMSRGGDPKDTLELVKIYNEQGPESAAMALKQVGAAMINQGYIKQPELIGFGVAEKAVTPYQKAQLDLREREVAAAEKRAGRPDTQVTIDNKQDTEIAKLSAKDYQNLIGRAAAANKEIATIGTLEKLSDKAFSGTGAGALLAGAKILKQVGIDVEGLQESEVYDKLANTLVLDKSQQLSGALSNADMTFLQNTVPSLNTTKEGRKMTFELSRKLAEREKQVAKLATEYRRNNQGAFDMGEFQAYLDQWKEENPLFEQEAKSQSNDVSWNDLP